MKAYELTLVLSGKVTDAKKKSVRSTVEDLIKQYKGKIVKTEEWGKIPLAAKIKKETSGNFIYFEIELNPTDTKHIDDKLRLDEDVISYLLIGRNPPSRKASATGSTESVYGQTESAR